MTENERTNVFLPTAYKQAVFERKLNLSAFVREAMRREFRRLKIQVDEPGEIKPGRPPNA